MAKTLYFELISGASGDMILSSLIGLGVPQAYLNRELCKMGIPGLKLKTVLLNRNGVMCNHLKLSWKTPKEFRHLPDILNIIRKAKYPQRIYDQCAAVLDRIALA